MILSFTYQWKLFLLTIVLGLLSAFIYHIYYILCKTTKINKIIKGLADIVYWFLFALALFLFMLKFNSGEVRPFAVAGSAFGMLIYYTLVKKTMDKLIFPLFDFIKSFLLLILTIITTPFRLILYPIIRILHTLQFFMKKHLKKYVKYEKITMYHRVMKFMGVTGLTAGFKKRKKRYNILWALIMIATICIFVVALCYQYIAHLQLDTAKQEIDVQIAEAKAESASLTKQFENQDSPEFIEKVAREKLNMVYPSELVYINSNSEEGKKLLNSIKRSSTRITNNDEENDDSVSTRVE